MRKEEKVTLDKWILEKYDNPIYRFNGPSSYAPTSQSEALGDDAVKASQYGIANLEKIMENLMEWSYQPREDNSQLSELYGQITGQWNRYMGHVAQYIGGLVKTSKTRDQKGPVFELVPKKKQHEALMFLADYGLKTPTWMINEEILGRIEHAGIVERLRGLQVGVVNRILDFARLQRLIESKAKQGKQAYSLEEMFTDLHGAVWTELTSSSPIDVYRRNLQRGYIERLEFLMTQEPPPIPARFRSFMERTEVNVSQSDIRPFVRGELIGPKKEIMGIFSDIKDEPTSLHLQDVFERIEKILNPFPLKK